VLQWVKILFQELRFNSPQVSSNCKVNWYNVHVCFTTLMGFCVIFVCFIHIKNLSTFEFQFIHNQTIYIYSLSAFEN